MHINIVSYIEIFLPQNNIYLYINNIEHAITYLKIPYIEVYIGLIKILGERVCTLVLKVKE